MLSALFVTSGIDVLRNPGPRVAKAQRVAGVAGRLGLPQDPQLLVRVNAVTHVVAGGLLAVGKFRRLAAVALMASLGPTTYAGHPFWEFSDPKEKAEQRAHFLKNVAVLGGLLLEAVDTEGRPSLGWRSRRAARRVAQAGSAGGALARGSGKAAKAAVAVKGADAIRGAASDRLGKGLAAAVAGMGGAADSALRAKGVTEVAARSKDLAGKAAKIKVAKAATQRLAG